MLLLPALHMGVGYLCYPQVPTAWHGWGHKDAVHTMDTYHFWGSQAYETPNLTVRLLLNMPKLCLRGNAIFVKLSGNHSALTMKMLYLPRIFTIQMHLKIWSKTKVIHKKSKTWENYLSLCKWRSWGTNRLNNLPEIIQLINGGDVWSSVVPPWNEAP